MRVCACVREQDSVVGVNLYVFVVSVVLCLCQGFYDGFVCACVCVCVCVCVRVSTCV